MNRRFHGDVSDVVRGLRADPDDGHITGIAYLGQADLIVSGDPRLTNLDAIRRGDGDLIARCNLAYGRYCSAWVPTLAHCVAGWLLLFAAEQIAVLHDGALRICQTFQERGGFGRRVVLC